MECSRSVSDRQTYNTLYTQTQKTYIKGLMYKLAFLELL